MRYLLDTHCWLWLSADPGRISPSVLARLANPTAVRLVSAATVWEIAIKQQIGKLRLPAPPDELVPELLATQRAALIPIELAHVLQVARLPLHHRDPFDRMLVAQAQVERAVLVTADRTLAAYDVKVLWADELPSVELHEPPAAGAAGAP